MHFADCAVLDAVLLTTITEILRRFFSEAEIILNLFLNFEQT